MTELMCYPDFPTTHGTASYCGNFYMSLPHRYFFKVATVNYGEDRQDGDIVGMKVDPVDKKVVKALYRGNPYPEDPVKNDEYRKSGVMDNCCSFLMCYQGKKISIKMFDNRFQICGTPENDIEIAQAITDYVMHNVKVAQDTVKMLLLNVVPDSIRESVKNDDFIGGVQKLDAWVDLLKQESSIFVDIEIEDIEVGIDMLNHNFEIPFLFRQKPLVDVFSALPEWDTVSNNDKTTKVKLKYKREVDGVSTKVKFVVDVGTGSILATGNCSTTVQREVYHIFMSIIMKNYEKVVYDVVPKTVLYKPVYT